MSLRLRPRASVSLADDTSIFDQLKPYIEKLLLSPQGIGLVAIGVGIMIRMTHLAPFIGPLQGVDQSAAAHMKGRYGLDQVVFKIDVGKFDQFVGSFVQNAVGALNPIAGFIGLMFNHAAQRAIDSAQGQTVDILLSDLLIVMGAAAFLGGSVQQIVSAIKP